ncbi:MAG: T9SS type A sorting domain-containing protein [Aquaticitalea sp.]
MKTKLLSLLLIIVTAYSATSQTEIEDYASGMVEPNYLAMSGTDMYVLGATDIYRIDTTSNTPTPVSIYTVPADYYLVNFTINGNLIYIALENYIEASDTFLGGRIVSFDLNNPAQPTVELFSTPEYISSLTNDGSTIYFASETLVNPPSFEPFITHLDMIDASLPNPTAQTIVNDLNDTSVIAGMFYDDNEVFMSSSDDNSIFAIDIFDINNPVVVEIENLNYNRGIFKSGDDLYLANGSLINKLNLDDNTSNDLTPVAVNSTYEDVNNGTTFFANFRDVVLIGNTVYMTLRNQGLIVRAVDATLTVNEFESPLANVAVYNDANTIYIKGLSATNNAHIYSLNGQSLMHKELSSNNNAMDISQLSSGIYILNIDNQKTFKFVK